MMEYCYPELNKLAKEMADISASKGFSTGVDNLEQKLLLAVGEICEAIEEVRAGHSVTETYYNEGSMKPEGFPVEIADTIIRLLQLCHSLGIDIAQAVALKAKYNNTRGQKHGKKF